MVQATQVEAGARQEDGAAAVLPEGAVRIAVAYAEKGRAKALGARWDPQVRTWYVPAGVALGEFAEWLPVDLDAERVDLGLEAGAQGLRVGIALLGSRQPCWKCNRSTASVVALRREDADLLLLDFEFAKRVARALLPEPVRVAANVGIIEKRFVRKLGRRALSNGCHWCDALQSDHRLFAEDLHEVLTATPEALEELVNADIPVDLWDRMEVARAEEP